MATTEVNGLLTYIDDVGNKFLLYPVTKADNVDGLDELLAGKAPAGYGLGASVNWDYPSANDIQVTGFYACNVNVPSNAYWYGMHIRYDANSAYQYFAHAEQHYCAERRKINGVWQPWEWANPPMTVGVEYRTTERWDGKAVYVKTLGFGVLPDTAVATINTGIPTGSTIVDYAVRYAINDEIDAGNVLMNGGVPAAYAWVQISEPTASIRTLKSVGSTKATITIKYTKD